MSTNDPAAENPRTTPWFNIDDYLPVHVGVYEAKTAASTASRVVAQRGYHNWDGERFGARGRTPQEAYDLRKEVPSGRIAKWRGIEVGVRWIARQAPEVVVDSSNKRTLAALNSIVSKYARYDEIACREILFRLESAGRKGTLLTYVQFVRGITFVLPDDECRTLQNYTIDVEQLSAKDEEIIHDFACYLGAATYRDSKVMINALLVTRRAKPKPPATFFAWARRVGQHPRATGLSDVEFWRNAVSAVHERYGAR